MSEERPSQEEPPDTAIVLHYIDKLYDAFRRGDTTERRGELVGATLALLLLVLSGGAASTTGAMTFGGFGLKIPLAVFLTGTAVFVGLLTAALPILGMHNLYIRDQIKKQYKSIGYEAEDSYVEEILFYSPTLLGAARQSASCLGVIWTNVSTFLFTATLPVAAMIATGFKVDQLLYGRGLGWVWVLFVLLVISTGVVQNVLNIRWRKMVNEMSGGRAYEDPVVVPTFVFTLFALLGVALGYFVTRVLGSA